MILTKKQILEQNVLRVFQKFDNLDHYTDVRWFLNLSVKKLIKFYKLAEDIWNYRAQLNSEDKKKIIPSKVSLSNVF